MQEKKDYLAEIQISYTPTKKKNNLSVTSSINAYKILKKLWDPGLIHIQEQFCVLFLNNGNKVIGFRCLSSGTISSNIVDYKMLFGLCCKSMATGIVIAHNHPSGNLNVSLNDKLTTKKINEACELFDIKLIDHIILAGNSYTSFADEGLI